MQRRHHFAGRIKRRLVDTFHRRFQRRFCKAFCRGECDQRRFCRLPFAPAFVVQNGIVAERHSRRKRLCFAGMLDNRHTVLRQRPCFVGADDVGAAQRLHRCQAADNRLSFAHIGHADGKHDRDNRRQAFRYRRNRQRNRDHKR